MIIVCCIPPAIFVGLLFGWVGCLIAAERQGGSRPLTITGWTCLGLATAMVVVPGGLWLFVWIRSLLG